jgi:hypothetical protein
MSLAQALNSLPRRRLLDGPTPIRRLHGIENALGSSSNRVQIYAKRDDHMSLGGGGNKLRKLEFLLGDAPRQARTRSSPPAVGNRTSLAWRLPRPPSWVWRANLSSPAWYRVEETNMIEMATSCSTTFSALASMIYRPASTRHISRRSGQRNCVWLATSPMWPRSAGLLQ